MIKYNTTFEDAVAGTSPKNGEISLRIRREVAEATGTTGPEGTQLLWTAMDTIGNAMQVRVRVRALWTRSSVACLPVH